MSIPRGVWRDMPTENVQLANSLMERGFDHDDAAAPERLGVQLDRMGRLIEKAPREPVTDVQYFRDDIERTGRLPAEQRRLAGAMENTPGNVRGGPAPTITSHCDILANYGGPGRTRTSNQTVMSGRL
jgi:hypothetical protein